MVGVGILIQKKDEYLIVKRAAEPDKGLWSIPGGLVEVGEKAFEAAIREAKEETNLDVKIIKLIDVIDKIVLDEKNNIKYHFIILDYLAKPIKGKMIPRDDALEARWIKSTDLKKFEITPTLVELFKKLNIY
jgi:ADP-ribose pyrophosphatase